jgi:hypothetical protein
MGKSLGAAFRKYMLFCYSQQEKKIEQMEAWKSCW